MISKVASRTFHTSKYGRSSPKKVVEPVMLEPRGRQHVELNHRHPTERPKTKMTGGTIADLTEDENKR